MLFINGKSVLVTGGTGSFGHKFIETVLKEYNPRRVIVFSRDELKQHASHWGRFFFDTQRGNNIHRSTGDGSFLTRMRIQGHSH